MDLNEIIKSEMSKSGGAVIIKKVPNNRRPTAESLTKLGREIASQISANDAMRGRSMYNASKMSTK